jgi:hypothetical protein
MASTRPASGNEVKANAGLDQGMAIGAQRKVLAWNLQDLVINWV